MKIALFDMDGTLTPARKEMGAAVVESLRDLMQAGFDIGIVSGSDFDYISSQCNLFFTDIRTDLSRVFIFPPAFLNIASPAAISHSIVVPNLG